jgi:hypothetical protein
VYGTVCNAFLKSQFLRIAFFLILAILHCDFISTPPDTSMSLKISPKQTLS